MATYIALLRGINMAGHKVIKMEDLRLCFESMRFKNVRTYIQSGNVVFESLEFGAHELAKKINKGLKKSFGHDVAIFLRTIEQFERIVNENPFQKIKVDSKSKPFVTFIGERLKPKPTLPIFSPKKDIEIISITNLELYSWGHEVKGQRGFPNSFIEKEFGVSATTRNWNTTTKLTTFRN